MPISKYDSNNSHRRYKSNTSVISKKDSATSPTFRESVISVTTDARVVAQRAWKKLQDRIMTAKRTDTFDGSPDIKTGNDNSFFEYEMSNDDGFVIPGLKQETKPAAKALE